jgi:hypothetical protein
MNQMLTTLSADQLQRYVPSAFATEPWQGMSTKYRMIPTIQVIDHLARHGFMPVSAQQGRTRIPGKKDFTRHVIRFTPADVQTRWDLVSVGDVVPQIALSNSHDGTAAYKIMMAMYRVACKNGLMVHSSNINEISVRHTGPETLADDVLEASYQVIEQTPEALKQIQDWSHHDLSRPQQLAYAEAALELHEATLKPTPEQLIAPRRYADQDNNVWTTMNRVQENLMRGGQFTRNAQGQRRHVRAVKSLNEDIRLNRALWKLTEALANQF